MYKKIPYLDTSLRVSHFASIIVKMTIKIFISPLPATMLLFSTALVLKVKSNGIMI
jgi:hypothetical protein